MLNWAVIWIILQFLCSSVSAETQLPLPFTVYSATKSGLVKSAHRILVSSDRKSVYDRQYYMSQFAVNGTSLNGAISYKSPNTWVYSKSQGYNESMAFSTKYVAYDSTYSKIQGFWSQDKISINGHDLQHVPVGHVKKTSLLPASMGLGPLGTAANGTSNGVTNLRAKLKDAGIIGSTGAYAIKLAKDGLTGTTEFCDKMVASDYVGDVAAFKSEGQILGNLLFPVSGVRVLNTNGARSQNVISGSHQMVFSRSTQLSFMSKDVVEAMLKNANVTKYTFDSVTNLFFTECSDAAFTNKYVGLHFGNAEIFAPLAELILPTETETGQRVSTFGSKTCAFSIGATSATNKKWVLGTTVLSYVYQWNNHDNGDISLAQANLDLATYNMLNAVVSAKVTASSASKYFINKSTIQNLTKTMSYHRNTSTKSLAAAASTTASTTSLWNGTSTHTSCGARSTSTQNTSLSASNSTATYNTSRAHTDSSYSGSTSSGTTDIQSTKTQTTTSAASLDSSDSTAANGSSTLAADATSVTTSATSGSGSGSGSGSAQPTGYTFASSEYSSIMQVISDSRGHGLVPTTGLAVLGYWLVNCIL